MTDAEIPRLMLVVDGGFSVNGRDFPNRAQVTFGLPEPLARRLVGHVVEAFGEELVADVIGLTAETREYMDDLVERDVARLQEQLRRWTTRGGVERLVVTVDVIADGTAPEDLARELVAGRRPDSMVIEAVQVPAEIPPHPDPRGGGGMRA